MRTIKNIIKKVIRGQGLVQKPKPNSSYISAEDTVNAAKAENLSVCDYVEKIWDQAGWTDKVINNVFSIVDSNTVKDFLEIGAGTGRYIEKTLQRTSPASYESYEIAEDWNQYLKNQYPQVKVYQASGSALPHTVDQSIDLVISHGVFVYLPFLVSMAYFNEIIRVTRPGGYFVFDCYTEKCFQEVYLNQWLQSEYRYPVLLPFGFVNNFFESHGFSFREGFTNKHGQGISEYLVFKKGT